ncbi:polyphosphate--glucose phosphotransferase [Acidipropionibacterium jensenii]|uniref:Polyphosphate glucokinase n=1 Tax=Acidipropionibacterium jensenii TaxID=1749 RepID=A0A3S4UQL6_9ACTN|nr:ROK family protein [Acidipropionibacterium jensenii]AZZ40188.1 ROK family protein [Acidipropionibacterium jensenii]MDN5978576.1 ROK family protein [Acidipropionibacterium jensenii]MDN5997540.1 ROK family protein [Acidipropionibacterium jensenii]MDN6428085.1 ROK family protein [Acidipropionibacterium jensenii]MDN6442954.1 ROK family protein [Acidipropionibacterium jensenii]
MSTVLGIDVGGSGIKGAPVDLEAGDIAEPRLRIATPDKSSPKNVAAVIREIIEHFADSIGDGPVGVSFPAPTRHGVIPFIANLDQGWAGLHAEDYLSDKLGRPVTVVNDADAAGLGEVHFGAAKGVPGVVILTTLGTGIGTAIINDGILLPNTELGHLEIDGYDAEKRAASSVKDKKHMSYKDWATKRLQRYYEVVEMLFTPDLFVVGGGVSKDHARFFKYLKLETPIVPATLLNRAGIIGAAWQANWRMDHPDSVNQATAKKAAEEAIRAAGGQD